MSLESQVKAILLDILDIEPEEIVPSATFADDLGANSIDLVEIFTTFENTFNICIEAQAAAKVRTVQDAIELVEGSLGEQGATS